jgi:fibro-slime domain-containing protein
MLTLIRRLALVTSTLKADEVHKNWLAKAFRRGLMPGLALLAMAWLAPTAQAGSTLTGYFFSVPDNNAQDPDFERAIDGGSVTGEVQNQLGPNGLPVVSAYGASYSGPSGPITMVNALGELQWWTPSAQYGITYLGQATASLPFNYNSMYVSNFPNGFASGNGNDSTNFLTAMWVGSFVAPSSGTITITSGSDDDSWIFIDGKLVVDNGGIHGLAAAPTSITDLSPGVHTIDIFYADRHTTGAEFYLSSTVNFSAVPEPGSLALLAIGAVGIGGWTTWRRRLGAEKNGAKAGRS